MKNRDRKLSMEALQNRELLTGATGVVDFGFGGWGDPVVSDMATDIADPNDLVAQEWGNWGDLWGIEADPVATDMAFTDPWPHLGI